MRILPYVIDIFLQQRSYARHGLRQIRKLIDDQYQTLRPGQLRHIAEQIIPAGKISRQLGLRKLLPQGHGKSMALLPLALLCRHKVDGTLPLDKLLQQARLPHAPPPVNNRKTKPRLPIPSLQLRHLPLTSNKHAARPLYKNKIVTTIRVMTILSQSIMLCHISFRLKNREPICQRPAHFSFSLLCDKKLNPRSR